MQRKILKHMHHKYFYANFYPIFISIEDMGQGSLHSGCYLFSCYHVQQVEDLDTEKYSWEKEGFVPISVQQI